MATIKSQLYLSSINILAYNHFLFKEEQMAGKKGETVAKKATKSKAELKEDKKAAKVAAKAAKAEAKGKYALKSLTN